MMAAIRFNNNKEFMNENKSDYIKYMRTPYYDFIGAMADTMLKINPQMEVRPHKALSRIYRDTRFSKDKSPYRDHHWVAFRKAGVPKEEAPMFWFEIRIESVNWGLGFWGENKEAMALIRRKMLAEPDPFKQFLKTTYKSGLTLSGQTYKKLEIPKDLDNELISLYPKKELYIIRELTEPKLIFDKGILEMVAEDYKTMSPMYKIMQGNYDLAKAEDKDEFSKF